MLSTFLKPVRIDKGFSKLSMDFFAFQMSTVRMEKGGLLAQCDPFDSFHISFKTSF